MSTKPVPEPWASHMVAKGCVWRGEPSIRALATKAGANVETTRRLVHRMGTPQAEVIIAVSDVLGVDVASWVGVPTPGDLYTGPDDSRFLNPRQRSALTDLIHAFVEGASWSGNRRPEETGLGEVTGSPQPLGSDDPPSQPGPRPRSRRDARG